MRRFRIQKRAIRVIIWLSLFLLPLIGGFISSIASAVVDYDGHCLLSIDSRAHPCSVFEHVGQYLDNHFFTDSMWGLQAAFFVWYYLLFILPLLALLTAFTVFKWLIRRYRSPASDPRQRPASQ